MVKKNETGAAPLAPRTNESEASKYAPTLQAGETIAGVAVDWRPIPRGRDRDPGEVLDVQGVGGEIRAVFKGRGTGGLFDPEKGVQPGDFVLVSRAGTSSPGAGSPAPLPGRKVWDRSKAAPASRGRPWAGKDDAEDAFKWEHYPLAQVLAAPAGSRPTWIVPELLALARVTAGIPESSEDARTALAEENKAGARQEAR